MLGHKMFQHLRVRFPGTVCTMRECQSSVPLNRVDLLQGADVYSGIDVTDFGSLATLLRSIGPRFIVNCVGIVKQRPEAHDPIASITINSLLPHRVAVLAAEWGGRLIHFSSDCVFSGRRGDYTEEDLPDAEDLYGRTKALGEVVTANALTLRTSIIGREIAEHRSLLEWFLSQNHTTIRGYRRVIYSGVTTNHLAETVAWIIRNYPELNGLYHLASDPISKFELLCLLREAHQLDVGIEPDDEEVSDRSMRCERLRAATGYECPPWPVLARDLAEDSTPYETWLGKT